MLYKDMPVTSFFAAAAFCVFAGASAWGDLSADAQESMSDAYWQIWNAEEQKKIDEGIEMNRKADGAFALPVPDGTEIEVEQIDHEFRFGANIFNFNQLGSKELNDRYKAMFGNEGLFNQATVPFYWREYEPLPGVVRDGVAYEDSEEYWNSKSRAEAIKDFRWRRPAPAPIIEFCRERGMTVYGHVLIYGAVAGFPSWVWYHCCPPEERFAFRDYGIAQGSIPSGTVWASLWKETFSALGEDGVSAKCPKFAVNARRVFKQRVEGVAARFGDVVDSWECTNESWQDWVASGRKCRTGKPIINSENYAIMPGDYQLNAFLDAMASLPKSAKLNINDNRMCPEYRDMVKDLIAEGAKVDVVGCQMHIFNTNFMSRLAAGDVKELSCAGIQPWTPESIRTGLDLMAEAGRPLHVSEITIPAPGVDAKSRMIQAIATRNFYRACFSHKAVVGITWWNTVDGGGYVGEPEVSGLMTKDLERKPAYDALDELLNHEWKTKDVVRAKDGRVVFRGFRGKYRLSWKCTECGQRHSRHVALAGDGVKEDSGAWECALCRPTALSFIVDGKRIALGGGESVLDLKKIYPDAVVKGREGERWATVEFNIVAPHDGEYPLGLHNDYFGEMSVNGGEFVATEGPWNGYETKPVNLRKGINHVCFRTRAGRGGQWTVGFRMPRSCGASFGLSL